MIHCRTPECDVWVYLANCARQCYVYRSWTLLAMLFAITLMIILLIHLQNISSS